MPSRKSGVLLHISSLPSTYGIGDFGEQAYKFVDLLKEASQTLWQILPLSPVEPFSGNSPYSSHANFAGNTLFISPEMLLKDRLIDPTDLGKVSFSNDKVEYAHVFSFKKKLLNLAYVRFVKNSLMQDEFEQFCQANSLWLDKYALYVCIKEKMKLMSWVDWPKNYKERNSKTIALFIKKNQEAIRRVKFFQFLFYKQWHSLKDYANQNGVLLIGDLPIYVNHDSVEVWNNPELFKLKKDFKPRCVAGVPPDYFSKTGQRWGNPVYNWKAMKKDRYQWWIERIRYSLKLYDVVRIDHFRAFINYWEIPAKCRNGKTGRWQAAPSDDFFAELKKQIGPLHIIAEDLGDINEHERKKIDSLGFSGMKILSFAFGDDLKNNLYLPHNYKSNCVVYTGTHDNNTLVGWLKSEADDHQKKNICAYLNLQEIPADIHWQFIKMALDSKAKYAIFPLQDLLGLDETHRMNRPGKARGNWQWRIDNSLLSQLDLGRLKELTKHSSRGG